MRRRAVVFVGLICALMLGTGLAETALPSASVRAGPYLLRVEYLNEVQGGKALRFRLRGENAPLMDVELRARAVPGTSVDAVPVRASLRRDPENQSVVLGTVNLPVRGLWVLDIYANGSRGTGSGNAPVLAATPPTIPVWFGWLIGLIPSFVIVGFVVVRASRTSVNSIA